MRHSWQICGWLLAALSCRSESAPRADAPTGGAQGEDTASSLPRAAPARRSEREALFRRVLLEANIDDPRIERALLAVPRHAFVPAELSAMAYEDRPLPIGHDQTISQPAVVATMTAAVAATATDRCLEIGTGSGYQAAVLAELCDKVYSIEYLEPLARFAETNLRGAGYGPERVVLRAGDGYVGWPEAAPFQVVVVTAAPRSVPQPLLDQLAVGGRLIIPVGAQGEMQWLELYRRKAPGSASDSFEREVLMAVRFVPFVGRADE